ncbi:ubiquitin-like-conjugating enzyme ATG10 [Ochlerotatus camptorhynchus]|uniref:ubiquitin-like-conjugating enzyme ATG10 n=1 Tax=Ochlerotatus camptorhynchus TaxID=644619 RepID=UPI0031E1DBF2
MTGGTLTERQFSKAAQQFLELSRRIDDGWELITPEAETVFLTKRLKQTLNSSIPRDDDDFEELIEQDPSVVMTHSDGEGEEFYQFEYHVVYSESYQVPVLYFNAYRSDGTMLRLEQAWNGFRDLATESREQLKQTLTQMEHPVLFKPFLALHPCKTAQVLGNVTGRGGNPIVTFISSYGPFVNLSLDLRYAGLVE